MNQEKLLIECSSVRFTNEGIIEFDQKKGSKSLDIKRNNIDKISLQYGTCSERPIVDILIGLIFLLAGIYIALPLLSNFFTSLPQSDPERISDASSKFVGYSFFYFPTEC